MSTAPSIPIDDVILVGGSRWARTWFRALSAVQPPARIHWVPTRHGNGVAAWVNEQNVARRPRLYDSIAEVFEVAHPPVAIVAHLPADYADTVRALLARDCHVLVETPFTTTAEEARSLTELASSRGRTLAVDLELMVASHLEAFKAVLARRDIEVSSAEVTWHDLYREDPGGDAGARDLTSSDIANVLPNVLSMLTVLCGIADVTAESAAVLMAGLSTELKFRYGSLPVSVSVSRDAARPARMLRLQSTTGEWYSLDFAEEPATVVTPAGELIANPKWESVPRPLTRLLMLFLESVARPEQPLPISAANTQHIVRSAATVSSAVVKARIDQLRPYLLDGRDGELPQDALIALREFLAEPLVAEGLVTTPHDETALDEWTRRAWTIIHQFACHPFTTQRAIAERLGIGRGPLARLNAAVRRSPLAQELMTRHGSAMKYWDNTVLPLIQTGRLEAARRQDARHPFRVGVYAGVSCMFFCTFCGRQRDAKYGGGDVAPGNEMFDTLFRDGPPDPNTFYLSGGLEPLTNPGIGALVSAGAQRGYRLSMYTNAFMLTPQLLEKQPGLWDLQTLRVSMYGADQESAAAVTGNPKAFQQVVKNTTAFLKARNDRGSSLKLGFNFVILPGRVDDALRLADLLGSINQAAGGRQIDFLTLREDYSVPADRGVTGPERQRLVDIFGRLRERLAAPDLCEMTVDYGYALHPLSLGGATAPLEMVADADMRPRGYSQISVVVDLLGDVYLYREAGFLNRPGADRYIIGRVTPSRSLRTVVEEFLASGRTIEPRPGDTGFFDIFDHVVTHLLNQADEDEAFGIPFELGPIGERQIVKSDVAHGGTALRHPTVAHPTLPPRA